LSSNQNISDPNNTISSALEIIGLSFSYNNQFPVLQDFSLVVYGGERVGIIGPNGAGKTTLFLLSCGVLIPQTGSINLFDQPLTSGKFHSEIGMVFQNPDDQLFSPSVWDDIAFGPQNLGLSNDQIVERVEESMQITHTGLLSERVPHHLSGGEKRMVAIAGVLAMHPRLIIYDEPNANLDIRSRRYLINFIKQSKETLLIASHDLEFILEVCNRVILLDEGRLIADGNPTQIMSKSDLMEAHGLECPHSLSDHISQHHKNIWK